MKPRSPSRSETGSLRRSPSAPSLQAVVGPVAPRDTAATPFTEILGELIERVPGAYAAALVDAEGETVDYTGCGDPFDLRVAAAHLQLALQDIARFEALGDPRWLVVRGERRSLAASALPQGYALGLLLRSRAAFTISTRALDVCRRALAAEAGWNDRHDGVNRRSWFAVTVETDRRGRPTGIGAVRRVPGEAQQAIGVVGAEPHVRRARETEESEQQKKLVVVEVLGAVMGLSARERGFRVRTLDGTELTLVRESGARWYADEPV